ncbi:hypothetical protein [uncultured Serinicoccus sp.]|uniref:transmembrane-type terpene cyclase n=1 Tax=uncultured Serinicoccus sp. TaxID=735514 RepID=UPI00261DA5DB|nr:hypothetical protein [uncultured Serinicoccus sp.]
MLAVIDDALPLLSGGLWTAAYLLIWRASVRDRTFGMPALAACLNLTWELLYFTGGVIYWRDYGTDIHLQTVVNGLWLILDIGILWQVAKYFPDTLHLTSPKQRFSVLMGLILGALAYQFAILLATDPENGARLSAFIQNLYMSGAFIVLLLSRRTRLGQSLTAAWCKLLGTLAVTISAGYIGAVETHILILGIGCLIFDLLYVWLLGRAPHLGGAKV